MLKYENVSEFINMLNSFSEMGNHFPNSVINIHVEQTYSILNMLRLNNKIDLLLEEVLEAFHRGANFDVNKRAMFQ